MKAGILTEDLNIGPSKYEDETQLCEKDAGM